VTTHGFWQSLVFRSTLTAAPGERCVYVTVHGGSALEKLYFLFGLCGGASVNACI